MKLSKYFSLGELTKSQTAVRLGIKNNPSNSHIFQLRSLCVNVLDPVRERFGIPFSPSSGFRNLDLNARLGGARNSQHTFGQAADIEVPGVSNYTLARWIQKNLDYDQLILESYVHPDPSSGWVHVSYSTSDNRNESLSYANGNYASGIHLVVYDTSHSSDNASPSNSSRGVMFSILNFLRDILSHGGKK